MQSDIVATGEAQTFIEMDTRDQQQIIASFAGEVIDELMYTVNGKDGISYAGINFITFFMGDIEVEPWVQFERVQIADRWFWSATVRARNTRYGLASLGTAEVPEFMEVHDKDPKGKWVKAQDGSWKMHLELDVFCRRKALSMAQRNAKRAVTPEPILKKWLAYFRDKKAGKNVEAPFKPKVVSAEYSVSSEPLPPKQTSSEPQDQKQAAYIKELLLEKGLDVEILAVYKYVNVMRVEPTEQLDQEDWWKYNEILTKHLKAEWENVEGGHGRWEIK